MNPGPLLVFLYLAVFVVFVFVGKKKLLLPSILFLAGVIQSILIFFQNAGWMMDFPNLSAGGFFRCKALAAGFQAVALSACFIILKHVGQRRKGFRDALLYVAMASTALSIVLCGSRASVVAVLVGAAVVWRSEIASLTKKNKWMPVIIVMSLVAFGAGMYFIRPGSVRARLLIWRVGAEMFLKSPLLLGLGADGFRQNYMLFQADYFRSHPDSVFMDVAGDVAYPYNLFLHIFVEGGLIGAYIFFASMVASLKLVKDKDRMSLVMAYFAFAFFSFPEYCLATALLAPICLGYCFSENNAGGVLIGACTLTGLGILQPGLFVEHPNYKWTCSLAEEKIGLGRTIEAENLLKNAAMMIPCGARHDYLFWKLYQNESSPELAEDYAFKALETAEKGQDINSMRIRNDILGYYGKNFKYVYFLRKNVKFHKGWRNIEMEDEIKRYFNIVAGLLESSDSIADEMLDDIGEKWDKLSENNIYAAITDSLSDEFLNKCVEQALVVYGNSPFVKQLDESAFRNYILPFCSDTEWVQADKDSLECIFGKILFPDDTSFNIRDAVRNYKNFALGMRKLTSHRKSVPRQMGIYELMLPMTKSDCHDVAAVTSDIFRACGIPASLHFTPKWPDRERGHFWCAVPDTNGVVSPFTAPHNKLMEDWNPYIQGPEKYIR